MSRLTDAVQHMADMFEGMPFMNDRTFKSMTCLEVEALADVFRAEDRTGLADSIIADHAEGDEEGDLHYQREEE